MAEIEEKNNDTRSPILNNPYEEPLYHYDTDADGNLNYDKKVEGRRPFKSEVNIASIQGKGQNTLFAGSDFYNSDDPDAAFINTMRQEVKKWRNDSYPRATRITRELLNFWFNNSERYNYQKLFFCQREAVETAVYLNEIADLDPNMGRSLLHNLQQRQQLMSSNIDNVLPRTAFKMATGTGKTVVMAMLILYHYINKKEYPMDTRFADHFLIVAPGITIRDRLGVLIPDTSNRDSQDYYAQRFLIPQNHRHWVDGLSSCITITNYHTLEPKAYQGKKASPLDGKKGGSDGKEDFSNVLSRVLGKNMKTKRFIVINDEAHHCYLPRGNKKADEDSGEDQNAAAKVWFEGLRQMKLHGYRINNIYDLSATPYYLKGSGYEAYSLFPWVVSDFGLVDAIESGLVKIPFLPTYDNSQDLTEPKLKNIYEHCKKDLPKKGMKGQRKADKENGKSEVEQTPAPKLPPLLTMALDQFVKDYEDYNRGIRTDGEAGINLFSTPPVFIVVCNNTAVSNEVYKYIAGYQSKDSDGNTIYVKGHWDIFSNYGNDNLPKDKPPTLLIDSEAIDDASGTINADFKKTFATEIANFKREYAKTNGAGSADSIPDGEILREVVNTVGKPGKLGGHIRCVVSVSMLTEGWDANTVTHVCGVRAFGSQLLCEQVAGRALRRMDYTLKKYDAITGEELPQDTKRTKDVVEKFPPEYAHIIGVPFKNFKGGTSTNPPGHTDTITIKALKEREIMEIRFPNIESYRSDTPDGKLTADFDGTPKFSLRFDEIPTETTLGTSLQDINENNVILKSDYRSLRDNEVIYELTRRLLNRYYFSHENGRQFHLFGGLKRIVQQWYDTQVAIIGGDDDPKLMRRLVIFWDQDKTSANIYEGIRQANKQNERITAVLNYYNPEGSTRHVFGKTSKPVYATKKSHVNYVVADTDSWEQIAAKSLEELDAVECYVKNSFLGFKIPYFIDGEEHIYAPDFIAKVKTNSGDTANLIIEISGFSDNRIGHKDAKRYYTENYWLPAANNLETYGKWYFIEITDIANIKQSITSKINSI